MPSLSLITFPFATIMSNSPITLNPRFWHLKSLHLLCTFHLLKNFWQHLRKLFVGKEDLWRTVSDMWWRLCKTSNGAEFVCFDDKFNLVIQLVKVNANTLLSGDTM